MIFRVKEAFISLVKLTFKLTFIYFRIYVLKLHDIYDIFSLIDKLCYLNTKKH